MDWLSKPRQIQFEGSEALAQITSQAEQDSLATQVIEIAELQDVLISPRTGRSVSRGLRFNRDAYGQLADLIAGGLLAVMNTLWRKSQEPVEAKRLALIRSHNSLAKLAWDEVCRYQLVVNSRSREVVGLISRRYQRVTNSQLLDIVAEHSGTEYVSLVAEMRNRDMFVLLRRLNTTESAADGKWSQGLAIYNSETTRRAVFLPQVIFDSRSRSFSLQSESKENKLVHRKSRNFQQQLDLVVESSLNYDVLTNGIAARARSRLQPLFSAADRAKSIARVVRRLVNDGFSMTVVENIAQRLSESKAGRLTLREVYTAILQTADQAGKDSRLLRIYAGRMVLSEKAGNGEE